MPRHRCALPMCNVTFPADRHEGYCSRRCRDAQTYILRLEAELEKYRANAGAACALVLGVQWPEGRDMALRICAMYGIPEAKPSTLSERTNNEQ